MDQTSRNHLRDLGEHLRMWRMLNVVAIKPMSNAALRGIKNGTGRHNTADMRWVVDQVKTGLCRDPVNADFVRKVMDLDLYTDCQALVAFTRPDDYTGNAPKVVGVVGFGEHDPDIPMNGDDEPEGPNMQWAEPAIDHLACHGKLAEIFLLCTRADAPGGLGRYLTAAAMHVAAKRRRKRAPMFKGIICSIAHTTRPGVTSVEDEPNYRLFTSLGGKRVNTYYRGGTRMFVEKDDIVARVYLALTGPVGHRWTPNGLIRTTLRIPTKIGNICPMQPGTGLQRCA